MFYIKQNKCWKTLFSLCGAFKWTWKKDKTTSSPFGWKWLWWLMKTLQRGSVLIYGGIIHIQTNQYLLVFTFAESVLGIQAFIYSLCRIPVSLGLELEAYLSTDVHGFRRRTIWICVNKCPPPWLTHESQRYLHYRIQVYRIVRRVHRIEIFFFYKTRRLK